MLEMYHISSDTLWILLCLRKLDIYVLMQRHSRVNLMIMPEAVAIKSMDLDASQADSSKHRPWLVMEKLSLEPKPFPNKSSYLKTKLPQNKLEVIVYLKHSFFGDQAFCSTWHDVKWLYSQKASNGCTVAVPRFEPGKTEWEELIFATSPIFALKSAYMCSASHSHKWHG